MNVKSTLLPLLSALILVSVTPVNAENACKGLSKQACDGSEQCRWVNGYTRKDGRDVAPYCRLKPAGKVGTVSSKTLRLPSAS